MRRRTEGPAQEPEPRRCAGSATGHAGNPSPALEHTPRPGRFAPGPNRLRRMTIRQRGTLAVAMLGSAIVFLDGSFVYLALQRIGLELPSTILGRLEGQTYITSGYLATLAAFLVLAGALGDYYGRRRIFVIGLIGFGADVDHDRAGPEPRAARGRAAAAGPRRVAARAELAVDHHPRVRGREPRPRVRAVGRRDVGARHAGTADRRDPRRDRWAGGRCS